MYPDITPLFTRITLVVYWLSVLFKTWCIFTAAVCEPVGFL